jgi:hypothetical protein
MALTTSGTVGTTVIDVTTLIEHAFRRCGKMPSTISGEQQTGAMESLFFLLTDLVNDGVSLWCIQKSVIPLVAAQTVYVMPPGTSDVISCNYRTQTAETNGSEIAAAGWRGLSFVSAVIPTNAQITFSIACTPTLVIEYSLDSGVTWIQAAAFDRRQTSLAAGDSISADVDNSAAATYWRVRDTSGTLAAVSALTFNYGPSEVPMTQMNRDDYFSLPNKTFQATKSLQYWFDKQIAPQIWLWPVPSAADQLAIEYHRQIQDVGSLNNLIEVPQRWYEYVIFGLACRVAVELPPGELPADRLPYLESKAEYHLQRAADGESDGAPIRLQPAIRGYTK